MAISEATGQVVLSATGDQVAIVVFGVSLPFRKKGVRSLN
jgi:hypothetical protein